jgi:hypothetical protein
MKLICNSAQKVMLLTGAIALTAVGFAPCALAQSATGAPLDLLAPVTRNNPAVMLAPTWSVDRSSQTALVQAKNSSGGIFAGVQCDPFDSRGRRLILGAVRSVDQDGLVAQLRAGRASKFTVGINSESAYSQFTTYAEDRGNLNLGMQAEFAAAYLSAEQYALFKAAKTFTVSIGERTYSFSGRGSAASIGSLTCDNRRMTVASRSIPARHDEPPRPVQTQWQFATHTGTTAAVKGRYEASTTIANFPNNELASFQLRISCHDGRLFALFSGGSVAKSVGNPRIASTNAFVNSIDSRHNVAMVYRGQTRIAAIPVDGPLPSWKGHPMSYDDIAALFEFDSIVVNGGDSAIEFGAKNAGPSIVALAQACGANG